VLRGNKDRHVKTPKSRVTPRPRDLETDWAASDDLRPNAAIGQRLGTVLCGVECLALLFERKLGTADVTDNECVVGKFDADRLADD
jgi:hypothetical protein